jgi:hypothetical protein
MQSQLRLPSTLLDPEILDGTKDISAPGAGAEIHPASGWNAPRGFLDYAPISWDYSIISGKSEMFAKQRGLGLGLCPGADHAPMSGKFHW